MFGKRIESLKELMGAAEEKQSVVYAGLHKNIVVPAAIMQNYQARIVHRIIVDGLYIYNKENKNETE